MEELSMSSNNETKSNHMDTKKTIVLVGPYAGKMKQLPLGLLSLARMINQDKYAIKIFDNIKGDKFKEKLDLIKGDVLLVAIAAMTGPTITEALEIAKLCRDKYPNAKIVWGGWHPTTFPEQTIKHELVDVCITGYAEVTFQELIDALENNLNLKNVKGIWYKENNEIKTTPIREIPDLNSFPDIPYELINIQDYLPSDFGEKTFFYSSSIGCPFRCGFCAENTMSNRQWRALEAERVVDDLEKAVKEFKIDSVKFIDNLFFVDLNRVKRICEGMIERNLNLTWYALARANQLNMVSDEYIETLKKAGCVKILIGAESASDNVLKIIKKDSVVKDNYDVAKKFGKHELTIKFSMMIGIPGETEEEMWSTIKMAGEFVKIYKKHQINFFFYTPYPGSHLYGKAIEAGFKEPKSLEEWGNFEFHTSNTPWIKKEKFEKLVNLYIPLCFLKPDFVTGQIKSIFKVPLYVAHYFAKIRYKLSFYKFPFEWWLYKFFEKRIGVIH